jgi:hypothetical protein
LKKLGYIPTSPQFGADPSYSAYFGEKGEFVLPISGATGFNLKPLKFALWNLIQKAKEEEDKGEIEEGTNF